MPPRRQILIVDDQRPTRNGLRALLSFWPQVEVVGEATNGQDAVDFVAERRPDVVLMDVRMPVMDGMEATRRIKSQTPGVKVILMTMHAEYKAEALAAGADAFLVKGGPSEILRNAICKA
jgi:DNA-binding NarL/FixJ family response regulator